MWAIWTLSVVIDVVLIGWLFASEKRHHSMMRRADKIVNGIDKLRDTQTAQITFSCKVEGWETVVVVDHWTGYSEQCFYSTTLEGAIDDALRSRGEWMT